MYVVHCTPTSSLWCGATSISNAMVFFVFLFWISLGTTWWFFMSSELAHLLLKVTRGQCFFNVFGGFHGFGRTKCFFMALESVLLPGERNSLAPILVPTLPPRSQHLASNPILINNPNLSTSIQTNPILTNSPNRPKSLNNYAPMIFRLISLTHLVNY